MKLASHDVAAPGPVSAGQRKQIWPLVLGVCIIGLLLWLQARYALVWIVGESMLPTIPNCSLVVVSKLAYRDSAPRRGDLVLVRCRRELIAKRIVGLPGETVGVKLGVLYVDGQAVEEKHPVQPGYLTIETGTLFADRYALVGDNRDLSELAVVHAVAERKQIAGKVVAQLPRFSLRRAVD